MYNIIELAQYLKVSRSWIYKRICLKEIPFTRVGRFFKFDREEIEKWLNSKERN